MRPGDEESARIAEVEALAQQGAAGVDPLLERLSDPHWAVRRAVVAALASMGSPAVRPLCDLLRTRRDDEARLAAAVDALVASTGPVEEEIHRLAQDPDPAVAADAAQVLGRRHSADQMQTLVELLDHENDNVAVAAIEALGRIGGQAAVDSLIRAISTGNFFRVFPAIDVLGRSGDPRAVEPLAKLADDPIYASEAVRALGRTGESRAVPPLARLLVRQGDSTVRLAALSLAELARRNRDRYGDQQGVEAALQGAVDPDAAARRLVRALAGAGEEEQVAIAEVLGGLGGDVAMDTLQRLLDAPAPVSNAAAGALQRLGRSAEGTLLEVLRTGDSHRRRVLLPLVHGPGSVHALTPVLEDPDPTVRALAAEALARIGKPNAAASLFPLLGDPNTRVAQCAYTAIESLGSPDTERLALDASRDPNPEVRRAAIRLLARFGTDAALPILEGALADPEPRNREAALLGLAALDEPSALDAVLTAARDGDDRTRAIAMRALGQASSDLRVTSWLLRGLNDPAPWVRYYACQALGTQQVELAAPALAERLNDGSGLVRVAAVDALAHLETPVAGAALRQAASSEDEDVVRAALIGLGIRHDADVLPILLEHARSENAATRLVAVSAMADLDDVQVEEALEQAARDPDEGVRTAAVGFLAGRPGVSATRRLLELARDEGLSHLIEQSLAVPTEGRVEGLLEAAKDADDVLAPRLVSALVRLDPPDRTALLRTVLEDAGPPARRAAATALATIGDREAHEALARAARTDEDPEVRRVAALLLAD